MAKVRFTPTKRINVMLCGGPYDGEKLNLAHPESGTMTFTAKGETGRYVSQSACKFLLWEAA